MNGNKSNPAAQNPIQHSRQFIRDNLIAAITIATTGSLILMGGSSWNIWKIYQSFGSTVTKQFEIQKDSGQAVYMDEALTMSAKMLVNTGDRAWETRYNDLAAKYDVVFKRFLANLPQQMQEESKKTDTASAKLFALEEQAFKLVKAGKKEEAITILNGAEYNSTKEIYTKGNNFVLAQADASIQQQLKAYQSDLLTSIIFALVTLVVLLVSWGFVLSAVRDYINDRVKSQAELERSSRSVILANTQLEEEAGRRAEQERHVSAENNLLQKDIGDLLNVVSSIEEGDLTVQAQVSDRATGLIGDTLNRLIESLGAVLVQVSNTADRVSSNSTRQKRIAAVVAKETIDQANSVAQVLSLTETVSQSAKNAATQLVETNESLTTLEVAVTAGQQTVDLLNQEINVLQSGSDRIVQQMKALGEFVGSTDRFVQDQGDIATQTQVLALNAALVAARAAMQRDPSQFVLVAQEFESIAAQVSQLARQTNEGLVELEQQSDRIHRVVSDVDGQVQRMGGLVENFTQGVKQTREVFQTVRSVTAQAVKSGEEVTQVSRDIVSAAESTATAMNSISTISQRIAQQSQIAQSTSDRLNHFATELTDKVRVFTLPESTTAKDLDDEPENEPILVASN
jgi:methyl-accepting chemotaxis protein PixJ